MSNPEGETSMLIYLSTGRKELNKLCPPEIAKLIFTCVRKLIFTDVSKVKDLKSVKGLYDGINVQITCKTECM